MTELEDFFATRNFKGSNSDDNQVIGTRLNPFRRIFLCGGNETGNFRTKLHTHLESFDCDVVKIEKILKDWYAAQDFKRNLLELETYFAALASIIPIVSESIGSAAEIGAFVSDIHIRKKLFIIIKKKHYSGDDNKSFIRYGPIKSYEEQFLNDDEPGIYEIDDVKPEKDIKHIAEAIIEHQPKQISCDFKLGYFQILLLADIINALVICDRDEIKSHFKYAMECAFPDKSVSDSVYKDFESELGNMLSVLKQLELIKINTLGRKYYIARHRDWFLHYRSKDSSEYKRITDVREQALKQINSDYTELGDSKKAFIFEKERIEGTITWLKQDKIREKLIRKAPLLYKVYDIPKKSGGTRTIAQPRPELKELQKETVLELEKKLPVHPCAKAYIKGINGILANAESHKDSKFFFKYDFKDFFPSIKAADFNIQLERAGYSKQDRIDFLRIFFRFDKKATRKNHQDAYNALLNKDSPPKTNLDILKLIIEDYKDEFQLSIGAPSSPFISNAIMFDFDKSVADWAKENDFIYTRFADDITISSQKKQDPKTITAVLKEMLKDLDYPTLQLNDSKQKSVSLKSRVTITGLNITSEHKVSLGRKKKKQIRAMIHHYVIGKFPKHKINELSGWLALANAVDSEFFKSMQKKYTADLITSIMQRPK